MMRILNSEPIPLRQPGPPLPGNLGDVLRRALARDPRHRYPDVLAMREALARARVNLRRPPRSASVRGHSGLTESISRGPLTGRMRKALTHRRRKTPICRKRSDRERRTDRDGSRTGAPDAETADAAVVSMYFPDGKCVSGVVCLKWNEPLRLQSFIPTQAADRTPPRCRGTPSAQLLAHGVDHQIDVALLEWPRRPRARQVCPEHETIRVHLHNVPQRLRDVEIDAGEPGGLDLHPAAPPAAAAPASPFSTAPGDRCSPSASG